MVRFAMDMEMLSRLLGPVRVEDGVNEVDAREPGEKPPEDVGLDVAERGLRLVLDAIGECLKDLPLEVRPWMQGGDGPAVGLAEVVVADAQYVVLHPGSDQRDLGFHE